MDEQTPAEEVPAEHPPEKVDADFAPLTADDAAAGAEPDPHHAESLHVKEAFDLAAAATDEAEAVRQYLKASNLAEAAREWYLAAVSCERVGDFLRNPKPPEDLERAFRMYRRAIAAYEQCGLYDESRRLSYRMMFLKMSIARRLRLPMATRFELIAYWVFAGFGYRPLRIIGTGLTAIVAYGLLYGATGGVLTAGESPRTAGFWECLYFSGITFSTVGYGDFVPAPHMRLAAMTEGALGVFSLGFFAVALTNRLRH
jgi:hypothetical protein